jgi:hypothetical protein
MQLNKLNCTNVISFEKCLENLESEYLKRNNVNTKALILQLIIASYK